MGYKNYCKDNGHDLINFENDNIEFEIEKMCSRCGEKQRNKNVYCKNCGKILVNTKEKKQYKIDDIEKKINIDLNTKDFIKDLKIKNKLLTVGNGILFLIVISTFIKLLTGLMGFEINKYVNIFSIILGLNLIPINIMSSSFIGVGQINVSMGIIICLIVPITCITISTILFTKKEYINENSIIKDSFTLSVIYGLMLGFISLLGKSYINTPVNEYYSMSIIIKYSFVKSILNGIIISFLPIYIVLFNKFKPKKEKFKIINKVLKTIGLTYLVTLVFLTISLFVTSIFGNNKDLVTFINLTQLSIYILQLVNLIPIAISNTIISIFNIGDMSMYLHESMKLFLYAIILLNLVILIVSGYDIKNKFENKDVIKHFSLVYSIVIGLTIYLSKIDTSSSLSLLKTQNYTGYSYIGASVVLGIVISFLYSYIAISLGYKLNKE
jgi:hypothetical protein